MKLYCDLCGGEPIVRNFEGVCLSCGMEYGPERLIEKIEAGQPVRFKAAPEPNPPITRPNWLSHKDERRMKTMWKVYGCICMATFFGVLFARSSTQEAAVGLSCLLAAIVNFMIFKPWRVYGGTPI